MKQRFNKLIVMLMTFILITQLPGFDAIVALAADIYVQSSVDVTISSDSTDNYIFISGGEKRIVVEDGVSLNGNIDVAVDSIDDNTVINYGSINQTINVTTETMNIENYNYINNISSIAGLLVVQNSGTIQNVSMLTEECNANLSGGDFGKIDMQMGNLTANSITVSDYLNASSEAGELLLNNCTVETLTSAIPIGLEGTNSVTTAQLARVDGPGNLSVKDSLNISCESTDTITAVLSVESTTAIQTNVDIQVNCHERNYAIDAGFNSTLCDKYGFTVNASLEDATVVSSPNNATNTKYWYGETSDTLVYEAAEGYYFTEEYISGITSNGLGTIEASLQDEYTLNISYTFSENETGAVTINLPGATSVMQNGTGSLVVSDAYYGASLVTQLLSDTNEVNGAVIEYKIAGADDGTYSATPPKEVGNYTARAILPANQYYYQLVLTDDFSISYLPAPDPAYSYSGTTGENNYYTSIVTITPAAGFLVSDTLDGNYSSSMVFDASRGEGSLYFFNIATGEKTSGVWTPEFLIDAIAPSIDAVDGKTYYAEYVEVAIKDTNLSYITINGEEMKDLSDGITTIKLYSSNGIETYEIYVKDIAGNSEKMNIIVAADWMKAGIIPNGVNVNLVENYKYKFGSGNWKISGDATNYNGNIDFYVKEEGTYTFKKQ